MGKVHIVCTKTVSVGVRGCVTVMRGCVFLFFLCRLGVPGGCFCVLVWVLCSCGLVCLWVVGFSLLLYGLFG